jgi:hypothetical protein
MALAPHTRLARTKADWRGFQGARDTLISIAGAALAAAVLFLAGFPHDAIVTIVAIGCTAVFGAVILPAIDFGLCWYRAPQRIQLAQQAESQKLSQQAAAAKAAQIEAQTTLRKLLLDYKRQGEEFYANWGWSPSIPAAKQWTSEVVAALTQYGTTEQLEQFTTAGTGTEANRLQARRSVLDGILRSTEADDSAPS